MHINICTFAMKRQLLKDTNNGMIMKKRKTKCKYSHSRCMRIVSRLINRGTLSSQQQGNTINLFKGLNIN